MRTTDILGEEHRWIRDMLECLSRVIQISIESEKVDIAAAELLSLFESFADGSHQLKEERVLFPRLMQRASAREDDLLHELHLDHGRDRHLMRSMQSNLLGAVHGEPLCLREFVGQASSYVRLHERHMRHENEALFPLAERLLTQGDDLDIVEGFTQLDAQGRTRPEGIRRRIDALCERLGVPASDCTPAGGGTG